MSLRSVRRARKITQEALAEMVGVDQTTISDLERGKNRNPSWETVAKLSKALGVPAEELFPTDAVDSDDVTDEAARDASPQGLQSPQSAEPAKAEPAGESPREGVPR